MSRLRWPLLLALLVLSLTACIGQVSRYDFDKAVELRGNGMTDGLVDQAFTTFGKQFPGGSVTSLSVSAGSLTAAVPVAGSAVDLDNYRFDYGSSRWRRTGPVRVSADEDNTAQRFDPLAVNGLRRMSTLVDTTRARSGLVDAAPTNAYVDNASTPDRRIRVTVDSPRGGYSADFTLEGVFVDGRRQ